MVIIARKAGGFRIASLLWKFLSFAATQNRRSVAPSLELRGEYVVKDQLTL